LKPRAADGKPEITFGELRSTGVGDVLVYCADYKCAHWVKMNADRRPDRVRLSDIEPQFICQKCSERGGAALLRYQPGSEPAST
jgi:hypothetical protein